MANSGDKWTREEHILAFNFYCKIPFTTIGMGNPKVIELAKLVGRSVGAASYKLTNFARLDPALQARGVTGHTHGAKGEEEVWAEFYDHPEALAFESERLLAARLGKRVEEVADIDERDLPGSGVEREAIVSVRVNQSFFRSRILSAYEYRCCVTGLTVRPLLVTSHIIPWAEDETNRLNARNGLCLNALHDRAFDRGLMWIDEHFAIHFSEALREPANEADTTRAWITSFEGQSLRLPKRFSPDPEFIASHRSRFTLKAGRSLAA
ncbi:MAG: HNH endonuclease [Chthoniobacteraceae bacterium]